MCYYVTRETFVNLPNCREAYIPEAKLSSYLLNHAHPQNKGKAQFFNLAGYNLTTINSLRKTLLAFACLGAVTSEQPNQEGTKYVVVGMIAGANGKQYELRTVWVVEPPNNYPRLVTAYPN